MQGELQKKSAETARFNNIFWTFMSNLILNKYDIKKELTINYLYDQMNSKITGVAEESR